MGFSVYDIFHLHKRMTTKEKTKTVISYFNIIGCFIGGFTINMATYFAWLIIPLLMKEHEGTSFLIGLADAITFGLCGLMCPLIGLFLNKKWFPLDDVCRMGFVFQAFSTIIIGMYYITGTQLLPIFFILIFQSFGIAFYWAIAEFVLSNEFYKHETNKGVSYFSMSWSLGKAIGFLLGGPMRLAFGNTYSLYFASVIVLLAWLAFPRILRNRSQITRLEDKLQLRVLSGEMTQEEMQEKLTGELVERTKSKAKSTQKFPHYYMMYYFNNLVIHFTVYGTIAVFGNQYIDFADEEHITLKGINDDPGTFASVFLGIIYFSQTFTFFVLGLFYQWQYIPLLNIIVQICIAAISIGMVFLRNGWVLCILAIPIGVISGYDLQASVIYALNAGPKIKGKILGLSECVGELTCALCPLFAGLLATECNDRRFALYQGIALQVIGIILCIILYVVVLVMEKRTGNKYRKEIQLPDDEQMADVVDQVMGSIEEKEKKKKDTKGDVDIPLDLITKKEHSDSSSTISSESLGSSSEEEGNVEVSED